MAAGATKRGAPAGPRVRLPTTRHRMETTITTIKSLVRDMDDLIEQGDKERVY